MIDSIVYKNHSKALGIGLLYGIATSAILSTGVFIASEISGSSGKESPILFMPFCVLAIPIVAIHQTSKGVRERFIFSDSLKQNSNNYK